MHTPMFSLEVFPPKRDAPVGTIYDTLDGLEGLNPDFISVTYGHGTHSDRTATARIANTIHGEYGIPAVAHLTALYSDEAKIDEALDMFEAAGVSAVLALPLSYLILGPEQHCWCVYVAILCGLIGGCAIGYFTEYYSSDTYKPTQELAAASHLYWADYGRYAEETWTSPVELPGKTGIVSIDFITGLTFTDELKDLYATLQANGIDVYSVSASPFDTVLAANETMGYNLPEDHVYAMRNKLGEDGRYINEYNYDWGGEGKYAQTQGEGKSTIITNFIAPQYDNAGPLMVFGDSSGDWNMMTDWMESGDTELGVIFNRYRKPSSDPIWQGSNEAAQSIGDPDARFVLQGRDENTGELRPSEKSILLGETDEVLVRPAE